MYEPLKPGKFYLQKVYSKEFGKEGMWYVGQPNERTKYTDSIEDAWCLWGPIEMDFTKLEPNWRLLEYPYPYKLEVYECTKQKTDLKLIQTYTINKIKANLGVKEFILND